MITCEEQIRKEVKSIAKELGVSEEDLLNDKIAEEVFAVEKDDAREHLNIVFIGHVGESFFFCLAKLFQMLESLPSQVLFCK